MKKCAATSASKKNLKTHLGRMLLKGRIEKGYSLVDLARNTRWSRSYLTLLENGHRGAEPKCLIELARALDLDPLALIHAAYRDRLDQSDASTALPASETPSLLLNYLAARELQQQQCPYTLGCYRVTATVNADGSLDLVRRYERCRPGVHGRPVPEIVLQEKVIGRESEEYGGDTLELLDHPEGLKVHTETLRNGEWLRHRIGFPEGWRRRAVAAEDELSFEFRRSYAKAYQPDPRIYLKEFDVQEVDQPFVGKLTNFLPHLVDRFELSCQLPPSADCVGWRLRAWWGRDCDYNDLPPGGTCRAFDLKTTPLSAQLVIDRPLAGYTYSLQWTRAGLAQYLDDPGTSRAD